MLPELRTANRPRWMRATAGAGLLVLALACTTEPVEWSVPRHVEGSPPPADVPVDDAMLCAAVETTRERQRFRAGWDRRSGALTVLRSADDGRSWDAPVRADARPMPGSACDRLPPSVFADSANGFLHVSYYAEPSGAPGVYYVHSMDADRLEQSGPGMFEQPWAITYGARAARTSVASRGDTVIIAYEDPNAARGGVHVAISTTSGHSFEARVRATPGSGEAATPRVQLRAGEILLWWRGTVGAEPWLFRSGSFR